MQFAYFGLEGSLSLLSFLELLLQRLPLSLCCLKLLDDLGLELMLRVVRPTESVLQFFVVVLTADQFLAECLIFSSQLSDLLVGLLPNFLDVLQDCLQFAV